MNWIIFWAVIYTVSIGTVGFVGGWKFRSRRFYRAALRKKDGNGTLQLAFQPAADGAMELLIPNNSMKALRRGQVVEGQLVGARGSMDFRVKAI